MLTHVFPVLYRFYEARLLDDVIRGRLPRHLGLIQDGHRRYAREAGLSNSTDTGSAPQRPKKC